MSTVGVQVAVLAELNPLEPVTAVPLFTLAVGPWQVVVSNQALMVVTAAALLLVAIPAATHAPRLVPRGFQNLIESVCVFLREEMARPILGTGTDTYIGFLWTTFFFILTMNLLGLVPVEKFLPLLTGKASHIGGPATANIWVTGALAVVSFVMTHASGIRRHGLGHYLASIAPPVPRWLLPLIYPLELLSIFVRPFTLAIRLFANIIAGHMVLAIVLGFIFIFKNLGVAAVSVAACVVLSFLELLVAFLQAYIFTVLTALYIGLAVNAEH